MKVNVKENLISENKVSNPSNVRMMAFWKENVLDKYFIALILV